MHTLFKQLKSIASPPLMKMEDIHTSGTFQLIFGQVVSNLMTKWEWKRSSISHSLTTAHSYTIPLQTKPKLHSFSSDGKEYFHSRVVYKINFLAKLCQFSLHTKIFKINKYALLTVHQYIHRPNLLKTKPKLPTFPLLIKGKDICTSGTFYNHIFTKIRPICDTI